MGLGRTESLMADVQAGGLSLSVMAWLQAQMHGWALDWPHRYNLMGPMGSFWSLILAIQGAATLMLSFSLLVYLSYHTIILLNSCLRGLFWEFYFLQEHVKTRSITIIYTNVWTKQNHHPLLNLKKKYLDFFFAFKKKKKPW